jgi:predicted transcriptional regulator
MQKTIINNDSFVFNSEAVLKNYALLLNSYSKKNKNGKEITALSFLKIIFNCFQNKKHISFDSLCNTAELSRHVCSDLVAFLYGATFIKLVAIEGSKARFYMLTKRGIQIIDYIIRKKNKQ